jgi:hypothetical protein
MTQREEIVHKVLASKPLYLCSRVGELRSEIEQRIEKIAGKAKLEIADQLELAYYRQLLFFYLPVRAGTRLHGYAVFLRFRSPENLALVAELKRILDYLGHDRKSELEYPLPVSARRKRGRPSSRRHSAVRALHLKIHAGQTWRAISEQLCDCVSGKHDDSCMEAIRQSAMGLARFLRRLGVDLPQELQRAA